MPLKGFWEQPGRSPVLAAFLTTGLITAVYVFAGGLVANAIVLVDMVTQALTTGSFSLSSGGDYLESVRQVYQRYRTMILVVTVSMQFLVFLGGTAWLYKKWHGGSITKYFKLAPPSIGGIVLPLLGLVCLLPVAVFLGEFSVRAFPFLKKLEDLGSVLVSATTPLELVFVIAAIGITPAICEEFLFRGYFQNTLSRGMSQPWSYLVTGTCFALIHQNYFGLGTLILVGVFLGFVFTRFGSLWSGAIVHLCYNSLLVIIANYPQWFDWLMAKDGFIKPELVLLSVATAPLAVWLIIRVTRQKPMPAPVSSAEDGTNGVN